PDGAERDRLRAERDRADGDDGEDGDRDEQAARLAPARGEQRAPAPVAGAGGRRAGVRAGRRCADGRHARTWGDGGADIRVRFSEHAGVGQGGTARQDGFPDRRRRRGSRAVRGWSAVQSTGAIASGTASDDVGVLAGVLVSITPRRRVRSQADVVRFLVSLLLIGVGVLVASWLRNTLGGAEEDLVQVYQRVPDRFAEALTGLALLGTVLVPTLALVVLVARRHFLQAVSLAVAAVGAGGAMRWLADLLADRGVIARDPTTDTVVEVSSPDFATSPLIAAAVALVIVASQWLSQQWRRVLWVGVGLLVVFRVVASNEPPLDIVVAIAVGMAVGSLALLVFGSEGSDPEAPELVAMLRSIGR